MNAGLPPPPWLAALQQSLFTTGGQYASLFQPAVGGFDPAVLAASYQHFFVPAMPVAANPVAGSAGALRLQRATQSFAQLAAGAAADAASRFQAALAATDPALPKITTLRALHQLWIECGEAAHAAASHAPAWAQAQAELLNALVELRAEAAGAAP